MSATNLARLFAALMVAAALSYTSARQREVSTVKIDSIFARGWEDDFNFGSSVRTMEAAKPTKTSTTATLTYTSTTPTTTTASTSSTLESTSIAGHTEASGDTEEESVMDSVESHASLSPMLCVPLILPIVAVHL